MKEDILKFRKVVDILKSEKGYKLPQLVKEIGVSEPTFFKLINTDINELKIQASVLGLVQDFNKKHLDDIRYVGIESIKEPVITQEKKSSKNQANESPKKGKDKINASVSEDFIFALAEAAKRLPDNVCISISINGHGN